MASVYVTGMGIVTALGIGTEANRSALLARRSGIGYAQLLNSSLIDRLPLAEIPIATSELLQHLPNPGRLQRSRLVMLGAIALGEALVSAGLQEDPLRHTGFINSTTVGGMVDVEYVYEDLIDPSIPEIRTELGDSLDCANGTEELSRHFGMKAFISTISTACSSSANAIMLGARLIRNGVLDRVICGGVDTLTRFTVNGFNSLKNTDKELCRPFDAHRNGLNLGEGSAYLVLESEDSAKARGRVPLVRLSGYCNFNEAFHPTAPNPEGDGAFEAMKGALEEAGLAPSDISYINAHGTATINNDVAEAMAMNRLFGKDLPPFSSTKCFTGHTLAPAGAIEAVYSILGIRNNEIYPVLNFGTPMPEIGLVPETEVRTDLEIKHVLSNSFGFGGNNASLLFSRYD